MDALNSSIRHNTWLIILSAIIFSFVFPGAGTYLKPYLNYLLMVMMFLSCLDLKLAEILKSLADIKNITLMLFIVHFVSPLIIFFLRDYFSPPVFLGLIIAAAIPAGRSSVFLSTIYGGVPIKALVSSSLSNFFSPILVPALVWIFAHTVIHLNPLDMSRTIINLVLLPLIIAVIIGRTRSGARLNLFAPSFSIIILFLIIVGIISPLKDVVFNNLYLSLILALLISLLVVINFCLGFFLGRTHSEHVTYAITSSYKNYTLATLLSLSVFSPLVALPSIIYTVVSNILLIPLQLLLQPPPRHRLHHSQNIIMFFVGIGLAIYCARSPWFGQLITQYVSPHLYPSAILGGALFASTFTLPLGGLLLLKLPLDVAPLTIILAAAIGAVICDLVVFSLFKNKVSSHVSPIYSRFMTRAHIRKILHTRYFAWTLPVVGALILASPLPDELAVSLLGLSRMSIWRFIAFSLTSHLIGIGTLFFGAHLF